MDTTSSSEATADELTKHEVADTVSSEDGEVTYDIHAEDESAGEPVTARPTGIAAGAAAVVCAGLGLASLTGTWAGTVLSERRRLIGQINFSSSSPAQQIEQIYGAAWHTVAAVNGAFALAAVLLAALLVIGARGAAQWVRVAAWSGLVLGVLGLLIAGGMWFDLFADLPRMPAASPAQPGG